jgi:hypothetical protein
MKREKVNRAKDKKNAGTCRYSGEERPRLENETV